MLDEVGTEHAKEEERGVGALVCCDHVQGDVDFGGLELGQVVVDLGVEVGI